MKDVATRKAVTCGWFLLAVFLPLGLTLEALHALKLPAYFGSALRRELWTLAHAHGNLPGLLRLAFGALGERYVPDPRLRQSISAWLRAGAVLMPAGFFLGGVLNHEGDPSWGIFLVPAGGLCLLYALLRAGLASRKSD